MDTIIAGRFDTWEKAETATLALFNEAHIDKEYISTFYVGPPGQHGTYPIGGDQHADPDAEQAHNKGVTGSGIGAGLAGAAALPAGPLAVATAAAVGAYAGSLLGSLKGMDENDERAQSPDNVGRSAGVMVAVRINPESSEADSVIRTLKQQGAQDIEKTEGQWRAGEWFDFDPVASPRLVNGEKQ